VWHPSEDDAFPGSTRKTRTADTEFQYSQVPGFIV